MQILQGIAPNIPSYIIIHIMIYTVTAGDFFELDGILKGGR